MKPTDLNSDKKRIQKSTRNQLRTVLR